jgi:hypothetical protein
MPMVCLISLPLCGRRDQEPATDDFLSELDSFLGTTMTAFWDERIASGTMHNYGRHHAIDAWAHLVKALVVRNHKRALKLVDTFFVLFEGDPDVDAAAAKALGEVPAPGGVLTKANGAVIRVSTNQ